MSRHVTLALHLATLGFVSFGLWGIVSPETIMKFVGLDDLPAAARVEFRAYYGGLELGFALFLQYAARRREYARPALLAAGSIFAGCASVRLIAMVVANVYTPPLVASCLGEAAGALLTLSTFRALGRPIAI